MMKPRYRRLLLALWVFHPCIGQPIDPRYRHQRTAFAEISSDAKHATFRRHLQSHGNTTDCSLCGVFPQRSDVIPPFTNLQEPGASENMSCQDLSSFVEMFPVDYSFYSECLFLQSLFSGPCCERPAPNHVCEQNIRSQLLSGYDTTVMPIHDSGFLDISLHLDLQHITDLSVKEGTVQVFVWFYLEWKDPRLAWNVSERNCTNLFMTRASLDVEKTEIWVPDLDLYNQASGVRNMPDAMATVINDGTVVWTRNGGLKALCFFTGLNRFPFDTLGCSFLIGAWVQDYAVSIELFDGKGFSATESLDQVVYHEYTLVVDKLNSGYYSPPLKSIVYYNLYFKRSSRYYVLKILVPTIVFTILAFGVFFLDLRVGERLTFGLTVMLVIIAQGISTESLLPVTDKMLWIATFTYGSFFWVLIANMESVFVAWLYFLGDDDDKLKGKEHNDRECNEASESEQKEGNLVPPTQSSAERDEEQVTRSSTERDELQVPVDIGTGGSQCGEKPVAECTSRTVTFRDDGNQPGGYGRPRMERRGAFVHHLPKGVSSRRLLTFRRLLFTGSNSKRHRTIKKIDRWCFYVLFFSYILFVIIMFATNSLWDDGNDLYTEP